MPSTTARYLLPDEGVDKLIIGSFCSIGSGAAFIMAGNQGHRSDWISTFPFHWMPEVPAFEGARNGYAPAGDTVIGESIARGLDDYNRRPSEIRVVYKIDRAEDEIIASNVKQVPVEVLSPPR